MVALVLLFGSERSCLEKCVLNVTCSDSTALLFPSGFFFFFIMAAESGVHREDLEGRSHLPSGSLQPAR